MSLQKTNVLIAFVFLFFSCTTKKVEPDNIYKYKNYISYTTSGIISTSDAFEINLTKTIDQWASGEELSSDLVSIVPKVKGKLIAKNGSTLQFIPSETLKSDTEYSVTIQLKEIFKDVSEEQKTYTFQCKTIKPNFTISTDNLQSYSKDWQYVEGVVRSADMIALRDAKKLVTAKYGGKKINVVWNESYEKSKYFDFKLDSIQRFEDDRKVFVQWNGKSINADITGEENIIIPGKNNFKVTDISIVKDDQQYISINFSDPLRKNQNFNGLVSIENVSKPKFAIDGNVLKVYHSDQMTGTANLSVFEGVQNTDGYKLKQAYNHTLAFEELKPEVRLVRSGSILPNSENLKFNFEAVNLRAVDVRVIKVYNDNVLQFLQNNNLNSTSEMKRVGRRIIKKTIRLIEDPSQNTKNWKAYSIDLSKLMKADAGAIYRVELSFKKEYSLYECGDTETLKVNEEAEEYSKIEEEDEEKYWNNKLYDYRNYSYSWREKDNPCHDAYYNYQRIVTQNLVASNLGVIAKKGSQQNYFFAVTDILTTEPVSGAKVYLYNFQQQMIHQVTTNSEGIAIYDSPKDAYFAIATKNGNTTFVKLNDGNSLSLSKFDVSGAKVERGLKGFIYGERGVWRPGDSIHLNFVLNDTDNKLPVGHPVKLSVRDPNGKLIYKKVTTENLSQFYSFPFATSTSNITGVYRATVSVGGAKFEKQLKVETVKPNRLKINIDFDKEVFSSTAPIKGKLQVNWLHGAPARNIKTEINAKIVNTTTTFKGYEKYLFNDPTRTYYTEEVSLFDGKVNDDGFANISKKIAVGKNAPGMLRVNFLVRAFENGGDFSIDAFSKKYAPYPSFVGMQSPKTDEYDSYETATNKQFDVVTVTDQGKAIARKNVQVKVYKIEWRWWWNSGRDNLSSYNSDQYHRPYKTITLNTNGSGKGRFNLKIPKEDRGRYLIRVIDPVSGHATGRTVYFYDNWWENTPTDDKEAAKMLVFNADKETYKVGEVAKITFPSAHVGKALISLENGNEVIQHQWVKTQKGKTIVEIPITKKMTPNFFVNISLLQPHAKVENDLPIRLYGTIPVKVEDPNTKLLPVISMPDSVEPEKEFEILVSEKQSKAMTYTLAIVEEGLLDLTRFRTPNPYGTFYAREALGVRTWDMYDDVIGAYSGSIDQVFAIGGDGTSAAAKNRKANRFKPVVKYLGPFQLQPGATKKHKITLPNYIGSVRTMIVAGDSKKEAYGNAERTVSVKKPLMVLATLPRKLSPGEKVTLPVTVFSMEEGSRDVAVQLQLSEGIKIVGKKQNSLHFDTSGEQMIYFELDVSKAKGIQTVNVLASSGSKKATYSVEIDVENPNPMTSKVINKIVTANGEISIDFKTFGVENTNSALVQISSVPPIDFEGRLAYLIQYPHGCVEQTTSSVFPQLFMNDLFDLMTKRKNKIEQNIKNGIKRLSHFQRPNGSLSYWMGESYESDWGTSYAGHFMLEAEKKGYVLPFSFKNNWVRYQKEAARNWKPNPNYSNDLNQAYRLYTLALSGNADLGAMNRLKEYGKISNEAKWRLAAAYALIGQKQASETLANTASIEFREGRYNYNYGSVTRNKSMALETMVLLNDDRTFDFAKSIAKDLSSNQWMSTQTTAYGLLAMGKMIVKNGGKSVKVEYNFKGKKEVMTTSKSMIIRELDVTKGNNKITLKNLEKNTVYVSVINKGKLQLGDEMVEQRGFSTQVRYTTSNGKLIDVRNLEQGQDFTATVVVKNLKNESVKDIALTQVFPSGWEIVNTRFTDYGNSITSKARHTDIRDDRVNFYFDMGSKGTRIFTVQLNASYLGKYYLPGVQVEAMYDNDYLVRTKGQWITVKK
tara:strand:- start:49241 stop:54745 length:5505 start_codon:yes stop_codon:yes gene_type:complete